MSVSKQGRKPEQSSQKRLIKRTLIASAIGIAILFILLLVFSAILLKTDTAGNSLALCAFAACAIAALIAGFAAVRPVRKNGLMLGAAASIPVIIVVLIACVALGGAPGTSAVIAVVIMLVCGGAGGIAAANKRSTRRHKV